jgi:hypothetical protein
MATASPLHRILYLRLAPSRLFPPGGLGWYRGLVLARKPRRDPFLSYPIKFRLPDGTDIRPKQYTAASTVATLKETIIAQWPKGSFLALATYLPLLSFFVRGAMRVTIIKIGS